MTFVVNLIHKDFSLLAADRQGNSDGPVTLKMGSLTVNVAGKTTIEGMKKIVVSDNGKMALGFAGTWSDHKYIESFKQCATPVAAMKVISGYMEEFFDFEKRDSMLSGAPQMENQGLMTFLDEEKGAYFTQLFLFTRFSNGTSLSARKTNPSPMLCHVGSGSTHFEKAVGLEEINAFIKRVSEGADLNAQLEWLTTAFDKVSATAPGCGTTFDVVLSTRENSMFISIPTGR